MHKTLLLAAAAALAGAATAFAATPGAIYTNADHSIIYTHSTDSHFTPPLAHRSTMPVIYQNFATSYPKGLYESFAAYALTGPKTIFGQLWVASAFTPAADATVREVDVALEVNFGLENLVQLHIYADVNGMPGQEIWAHKVAIPPSSSICCNIIATDLKAPVHLTAGTQYWLGITTLDGQQTVFASANLSVLDQVDPMLQATNRGAGWVPFDYPITFAFGIYGK